MKAIIYTSNTGSTAEYAQLLGKELNLPVHSLQQVKRQQNCINCVQSVVSAWDRQAHS